LFMIGFFFYIKNRHYLLYCEVCEILMLSLTS
jgi:hypothetical protein